MSKRSQFSPEVRAKIVARVEIGVPFTDAATAAGVKPATAKSWLARGRREESGEYADFAVSIEEAREQAPSDEEVGDRDELRRRVWRMVQGGSVEAAKLYHRMLSDPEAPDDPRELLGLRGGSDGS